MKTKFLFILLLSISSATMAQTKVADKFFERFAYIKASELYKEAYDKGENSLHVLTRLGDCYYNNSNPKEADKWYGLAMEKYGKAVKPEHVFKYIQTLRSLGKYEAAQKWMQEFTDEKESDSRAEISDLSIFNELSSGNKTFISTKNLSINSDKSDFGTFIHDNILFFASARGSNLSDKTYKWNEEPFLDIYQATIENRGDSTQISEVRLLDNKGVNSPFHEASVAITQDGQTMYFTRDNTKKGKRLKHDKNGTTHLKIYKATLVNGIWDQVEDLPFNDDVFSTGHPALSPDNTKLYFVSDRDGGPGQTDIYVVDIHKDGSYGVPKLAAHDVNTEGREMFPFVDKNNVLYFSSDGHVNLGFLDIFKVDLNNDNSTPENLAAPYNSGYDDFAYFSDQEGTGYFSSNRPGGKGGDDIYSFQVNECTQIVKGIILDKETKEPLAQAHVELIGESGKVLKSSLTETNGAFLFELDCDKAYTIKADKIDFKDDLKELESNNQNAVSHSVNLELEPLIKGNQIVIAPIFFDFDKWHIRTDAKYELENIVSVMNSHPDMVIKIESHTDSRGSKRYNMKLSDKRAKATRDYIISRGIDANRIESAIGYGESQLLNECADGVKCSEEKHQENRRSYFYIIKQ